MFFCKKSEKVRKSQKKSENHSVRSEKSQKMTFWPHDFFFLISFNIVSKKFELGHYGMFLIYCLRRYMDKCESCSYFLTVIHSSVKSGVFPDSSVMNFITGLMIKIMTLFCTAFLLGPGVEQSNIWTNCWLVLGIILV